MVAPTQKYIATLFRQQVAVSYCWRGQRLHMIKGHSCTIWLLIGELSQHLNASYNLPNACYNLPNACYNLPNAWYNLPTADYWTGTCPMLVTTCPMLVTTCPMPVTICPLQIRWTGTCPMLVTTCPMPVTTCPPQIRWTGAWESAFLGLLQQALCTICSLHSSLEFLFQTAPSHWWSLVPADCIQSDLTQGT